MTWVLLTVCVFAVLVMRRIRRTRFGSVPIGNGPRYLVRAWVLGWWPLPPSAASITRQLISCAVTERLPIGRDRFLAPTAVTLGISPVEFAQLEGRISAVATAIAESMQDTAHDLGWRTQGRPRVNVEPDSDA